MLRAHRVFRLPRHGAGWLGTLCYGVIVFGPFLGLVFTTLQGLETPSDLALVIPNARRLGLLFNSIVLATGVAAITSFIGWFGAFALWSTHRSTRFPILGIALPLVALPPYIHALAWIAAVSAITRSFQGVPIAIYGFGACLFVEVAAFVPIAVCFAWFSLRIIDPELIETARLNRSDIEVLWRIILPLSWPGLLTGGVVIFLFSLLDYSLPSLLQFNVYSLEVFAEFNATHNLGRAFLIALPLLLLSVALVAVLVRPLRSLMIRSLAYRSAWTNPPRWPAWFRSCLGVVALLLLVQVSLPLITLVALSANFQAVMTTLTPRLPDLIYSFSLACAAALVSLPIAALAGFHLLTHFRSSLHWFIFLLPIAVPASLVGISLSTATRQLGDAAPVLAAVARFLPLAVLMMTMQFRRVDTLLFDAARIFQADPLVRHLRVSLPVLAPGIAVSMGSVFALTIGELGATLLVIPPGRMTITISIYNYLHYGASEAVAGLCLILMLVVLAFGVISTMLLMRRDSFYAPDVSESVP